MPIFLNISTHAPENCPMLQEKPRKIALELADKMEALAKKHGVKVLGVWAVYPEHITFFVVDAPSLEAYEKLSLEPEFAAWYSIHTGEDKIVLAMPDIVKMLRQAK